jgi:hypothetical protein
MSKFSQASLRVGLRTGLLLAALAGAQSSYAGCTGCVPAIMASQVAITTAISTSTATIVAAINSSTAQIVGTIKGVGQATNAQLAQSSKLVADGGIQTAANTERVRIAAKYSLGDPCAVTIGAAGTSNVLWTSAGAGAGVGRGGGGARASSPATYPGSTPELRKAISWAKGDVPAPSPEEQARTAAMAACGSFVSGGLRAAACTDANIRVGNSTGFENADIIADTVFDGPQRDPRAPSRRLTVDMQSNDRTAIEALIRNVETPLVLSELRRAHLESDEGRRYLSLRDNFDARISFAGRPMRRHIASITANQQALVPVEQMLASPTHGQFVEQTLNRSFPAWRQRGISSDELMSLEVQRRHANEAWHKFLVENPNEIPREAVQLMALQSMQLQQIGQELRELNLLQGAILAGNTRSELMPQLMAAHKQATNR